MHNNVLRQFFSAHRPDQVENEVEVYITDAPAPDFKSGIKIFDSNSSFAIYSYANDNYVVDKFPPYSSPVWIARIYSGGNRVIIYCNPDIIEKTDNRLICNPVGYPLDQILMMIFLASRQGAIIHSAGWCLDGGGFVFAGKSGAGKSTISNLIDQAGTGLILSDDRIVVRKIDDQFFIYGTPWPGESGIAVNQSAPLKGILFLKQGNENRIADLKSSDAMSYLFPVMSIPWHDRENVSHMMDFCESLLSIIPMYELTFCADETAADFVNEFIDG